MKINSKFYLIFNRYCDTFIFILLRFYELDLNLTLQENLKNKTVIEFPIMYIAFKDHSDMFEIIDSGEKGDKKMYIFPSNISRKKIKPYILQMMKK